MKEEKLHFYSYFWLGESKFLTKNIIIEIQFAYKIHCYFDKLEVIGAGVHAYPIPPVRTPITSALHCFVNCDVFFYSHTMYVTCLFHLN